MKKHKIPNIVCTSAKAFECYHISHSEEVQGAKELDFIIEDRIWGNGCVRIGLGLIFWDKPFCAEGCWTLEQTSREEVMTGGWPDSRSICKTLSGMCFDSWRCPGQSLELNAFVSPFLVRILWSWNMIFGVASPKHWLLQRFPLLGLPSSDQFSWCMYMCFTFSRVRC